MIEKIAFPLDRIYPDARSIFSSDYKTVSQIKSECLVGLDANVLLTPYNLGEKGLAELARAYKQLADAKRLVIPGQAAREFAKNKDIKLAAIRKALLDQSSKSLAPMRETTDFLEGVEGYKDAVKISGDIENLLKNYRKVISKVVDGIESWRWDDPVSRIYKEIFIDAVIDERDHMLNVKEFEAELTERYNLGIPPGYKDASKGDGGAGDYIIWKTILSIGSKEKSHFVFVTADQKADWWTQSDGSPVFPRHELIAEYYRASDGKTFHLMLLSDFSSIFGVEQEVVAEIRRAEKETSSEVAATGSLLDSVLVKRSNNDLEKVDSKRDAESLALTLRRLKERRRMILEDIKESERMRDFYLKTINKSEESGKSESDLSEIRRSLRSKYLASHADYRSFNRRLQIINGKIDRIREELGEK